MFGLSIKDKAHDALIKAANVVLLGSFFHRSAVERFGLNREASTYLYSEAQVHQMAVLIMVFMGTVGKNYQWADLPFLCKALSSAFKKAELKASLLDDFFIPNCAEILKIPPDLRSNGQHFRASAKKIKELDVKANETLIVEQLTEVCDKYYAWAVPVFEC